MKILHVVSTLNPQSGGIVSALYAMNWALAEAGHDCQVLCLDDPNALWLADPADNVIAIGPGQTSYQYHKELVTLLLRLLPTVDVCVVHGLWQFCGYAVRLAALKTRTPYFVFTHGMLDPWFKRTYPMKHLKKWLYWPWGEYRVLRDAAAVLFTCEDERLLARKSFPQLYRAREEVVGLGIRDTCRNGMVLRERFLNAHSELRSKRILLFLGRLHPKKGLDLLIRAFGQVSTDHPDLRLVIAGSVSGTDVGPDYLTMLKELARLTCPPESVLFCGMLEGNDKWAAFHSAEAFVLTSHQENFGMAVAEALSCALPVLISDKVNIWREIEQDGAGLVGPDTQDGTDMLLNRWLALSHADQLKMFEKAKVCFENRFEVGRVADTLVGVIRRKVALAA